ncbi:MAG: hypothetical protein ACW98X_11055 [Promethearchaeota archaeon]
MQSNTQSSQQTSFDCTEGNKARGIAYNKCVKSLNQQLLADKKSTLEEKAKYVHEICWISNGCSAENITITQTVKSVDTKEELATLKSDSQTDLKSDLQSTVKASSGLLQFGNSTKSVIDKEINNVVQNVVNNLQDLSSFDKSSQVFNMGAGNYKGVTVNQATETIRKNVAQSDDVNRAVTKLADTVASTTIVSNNGLEKIFGPLAGFLIICLVFYYIYKQIRNGTTPAFISSITNSMSNVSSATSALDTPSATTV